MTTVTRKRVSSWTGRKAVNTAAGVAAYVRVSQDKIDKNLSREQRDVEQRLAVKRQRAEIVERARRDGVDPAQIVWFEDNDLSATKRGVTRPDFERLLDLIERGEIGTLYVWAADRLLRTLREWVIVKDAIDSVGGVKIVAVTGIEIDPSSTSGSLIFGLMVIMAENEGALKSERQRSKYAQQVQQGEPPRIRGFGYNKDGSIIESEATWVREIFRRFNAGHPMNEIVRWLDEENVRNTRGTKWLRYSLRSLLSDPRYISQRARFNEGDSRNRQVINEQGAWPSIIDRADFEVAQIRLNDHSKQSASGNALKHLGSGLYICGKCNEGRMMTLTVQSNTVIDPQTGKKQLSRGYRCEQCGMSRTRAVEIDAHVSAVVQELLRRENISELLAQSDGGQNAVMAALSSELDELAQRKLTIAARLDEALESPTLFDALSSRARQIDAREAQIRDQLDGMHVDNSLAMLVGVDDAGAVWDAADVRTRQNIMRALDKMISLRVQLIAGPGKPRKSLDVSSVKITVRSSEWVKVA